DQGLGQARAGAAQADAVALVEAALGGAGRADVDARQALQGVGDVLGGQLADVLGADHFHVRIRLALGVERALHAAADAGDDHLLDVGDLVLVRRGVILAVLRMDMGAEAEAGDDRGGQCGFAVRHGLSPVLRWIGRRRLRRAVAALPATAPRRASRARWPLLRMRVRSGPVAAPGQVPAGRADHAQLPVLDQLHGNAFERLAHRSLVEEALDEAA